MFGKFDTNIKDEDILLFNVELDVPKEEVDLLAPFDRKRNIDICIQDTESPIGARRKRLLSVHNSSSGKFKTSLY